MSKAPLSSGILQLLMTWLCSESHCECLPWYNWIRGACSDGRQARRGTNYGSVHSYGRQECGRAPASYCGEATLRNLKSVLSEMRYRCTRAGSYSGRNSEILQHCKLENHEGKKPEKNELAYVVSKPYSFQK